MLQVRTPTLDFSKLTPHWAPNRELVAAVNANGIIPAYIEPFLVKVTRRAMIKLDPVQDAELLHDIVLFNMQEGQHYKLHRAFNALVREGYPRMAEYEQVYERDYARFLDTKSLRWLLAYCEGFESIGSAVAHLWVDGGMDEQLGVTGPNPALEMWKWHLAEEFEHRTVMFRLYHRLYGKPRALAYLFRVYGVLVCARHMQKRTSALHQHLLAVDRAGMSATERAESKRRESALTRRTLRDYLGCVVHVLSPFYDPANATTPAHQNEVLARYPAR